MIIWKGRGILIPIFGVLGMVVAGGVAGVAAKSLGGGAEHAWTTTLTIWGGVAGVWLFALTLGKSKSELLQDPTTGRPVMLKTSHTLYFMPPIVWAVVATLLGVMVSIDGFTSDHNRPPTGDPAALSLFDKANSEILSNKGATAHGNTPEAAKLAASFGKAAKMLREITIEKGKQGTFSLTDGEFLTYAHVTPAACVFLVHVPDLRKFSSEAKETMGSVAWMAAQKLAAKLDPKPAKLGVGIRGAVLYDRGFVGHVVAEGADPESGITQQVKGSDVNDLLAPLFMATTAPAPVPVPAPQVAKAKAPEPAAAPEPAQPKAAAATLSEPPAATAVVAPEKPQAESPPPPEPAAKLPTDMRDWKANDGRPLRAVLVKFTTADKTVGEFKREDGQVFQVPMERFSAEDQAFARALQAE